MFEAVEMPVEKTPEGPVEVPVEQRRRRDDVVRRRALLGGLALLAVLNVADVIITNIFLGRGVEEGNPVGRVLMDSNTALAVKLLLIGLLSWRAAKGRLSLGVMCAMWTVVGVYAFAFTVNLWVVIVAT